MERKFKIIKTQSLGSGTYANVYLCQKRFSRKRYAAKVVDINGDNRLRLETENEIEVHFLAIISFLISLYLQRE